MNTNFQTLREWIAQALEYTLGNPSEAKNNPPLIGTQPYSQKPIKAH